MRSTYRWTPGGGSSFRALGLLLLMLLPICGCQRDSESRRSAGPPALDLASTNLLRTRIVATLDAPLQPGTNLIWCASFQRAWKELATALKEQQPVLKGAEALCGQLNAAPDPRGFLPTGSYYAAAGDVADGIVARIRGEMTQRFPSAPLPDFGGLRGDELASYAYLEVVVTFKIPYFDNEQPVDFADSPGTKVPIKMFGIRKQDDYACYSLRLQVEVLFGKDHGFPGSSDEFAVDICKESPEVQIVVASVEPAGTLAGTLLEIDQLTKARPRDLTRDTDEPGVGDLDGSRSENGQHSHLSHVSAAKRLCPALAEQQGGQPAQDAEAETPLDRRARKLVCGIVLQ